MLTQIPKIFKILRPLINSTFTIMVSYKTISNIEMVIVIILLWLIVLFVMMIQNENEKT